MGHLVILSEVACYAMWRLHPAAFAAAFPNRRDGRVVEGARLESVYRGNSIQGSNPCLSAIIEINSLESRYKKFRAIRGDGMYSPGMPMNLYRRHRPHCEGGHPFDSRSGEFQERKRTWRKRACYISALWNTARPLQA